MLSREAAKTNNIVFGFTRPANTGILHSDAIDHHEVETDLEVEEGISYGFQEKYPIQIRLDNNFECWSHYIWPQASRKREEWHCNKSVRTLPKVMF